MAGSEDFSILPAALNAPSCFWVLGGFADLATAPGNHSPAFLPELESLDVRAILVASAPWPMRS